MFINMFTSIKVVMKHKTCYTHNMKFKFGPTSASRKHGTPLSRGVPGRQSQTLARRRTRRGVPDSCVPSGIVYPQVRDEPISKLVTC
jgi:hypothetical protein